VAVRRKLSFLIFRFVCFLEGKRQKEAPTPKWKEKGTTLNKLILEEYVFFF